MVPSAWKIDLRALTPNARREAKSSWLSSCLKTDGDWKGVGCVACRAARSAPPMTQSQGSKKSPAAARAFADFVVTGTTALQWSNVARHSDLDQRRQSVMTYLELPEDGQPEDVLSNTPSEASFQTVLDAVTTGTAPSRAL